MDDGFNGIEMTTFSIEDAVFEGKNGIIVSIRVTPSAKKNEATGYDNWRKRINVNVSQSPEDGKANKQLTAFFRSLFPEGTSIRIIAGKKTRDKRLTVEGIGIETVQKVLLRLMDE